MKKYLTTIVSSMVSMLLYGQVTVPEPEFTNTYHILTSDSTMESLPKEAGTLGKHETKVRKWAKVAGAASNVVGAVAPFVPIVGGSLSAVTTAIQVSAAASTVSGVSDAVVGLSSVAGMDIVFQGGHSSYIISSGTPAVRLLIKGTDNSQDPLDVYRLVRFSTTKKERRIQWMEFESSLLGTEATKKGGYLSFTGEKYGEQSYLLTIPGEELIPGEYGIFYMSVITATAIPVGTFGVK